MFIERVLEAIPEPWQAQAARTIEARTPGDPRNGRLSIRAGHGVGKTAFIAWIILAFILKYFPCKIPVTANSQDQLRDIIWPEINLWANKLPKWLRDRLQIDKERVYLKGAPDESFAVARTASDDNPEALQGFHSQNLLFVIEEASGISDIVFEVARGSLSTEGAMILMMANPTRNSGYFYNSHTANRDRWHTMRVNSEDVPRARGHINDIIAEYGIDSNQYRVRVLGEFPLAEQDTLIPLHLCESAIDRNIGRSSVYPVWGVDVARFGDDRSALAKRQGNKLLEPVKSWRNLDTMQLVGKIVQEWKDTEEDERPSEILVDSIGLGSGVVDRLAELGLPARGVNVGESPSISESYSRLRDELWFRCRGWFADRTCSIPRDDALIAELTSVKLLPPLSTGKSRIEPKDLTKKRLGRSCDLADALVLTFAGGLDRIPDEHMDRYRRVVSPARRGSWMSV